MRRKKRVILFTVTVILILFCGMYVYKLSRQNPRFKDPSLQYSQEYIAGTGNIKGNVNTKYFTDKSADFQIGANRDGVAVFKNPDAAFARLETDDKAGIELIQKEFKLPPFSQSSYGKYELYGWQATAGTKEEQEQASFVSSVLDIYEDSIHMQ